MAKSGPDANEMELSEDSPGLEVVRIGSDRRLEAIRTLVDPEQTDRSAARRFLEYAQENAIRLDLMWCLVDSEGRLRATMLAVPNRGRTAMIFASTPANAESVDALASLIDRGCLELDVDEINLAQSLIDPGDTLRERMFVAGGFQVLAPLSYLERPVPASGRTPAPKWPDGITTTPFADAQRKELLEVLDASYENTLDCPGLGGLRRTEDILAGHMGTGVFDPRLWTMLREGDRACGVLMLNPAPASNTIELVYLGLRPELRGRALGKELVRHGLHLVVGRRERAITLAVDDRNAPAIALYHAEGFRRVLRRTALIRSLTQMT